MIIDTFPAFRQRWSASSPSSVEQIESTWSGYIHDYPTLWEKQLDCYKDEPSDWQSTARERVFPLLRGNFALIETAHRNLQQAIPEVLVLARQLLPLEADIVFLIYVGIGCGAGWATTYEDHPAVLLGLEKIAECRWQTVDLLRSLVSHEYGHLYQSLVARNSGPAKIRQQLQMLFEEGFAQRVDHLLTGAEGWSLCRAINDNGWPQWCHSNRGRLAAKFLQLVEADQPVNSFFGDWLDVDGRKQVGYFLGHELITSLEANMKLEQIACMDQVEGNAIRFLERCIRGEA